jgi:opacity protein-like surface antigen
MAVSFRIAAAAVVALVVAAPAKAADVVIEEPVYQEPVVEYHAPPYYTRFDCGFAIMDTPEIIVGDPRRHFIEKNGGRIDINDSWSCDIGFGHYFMEHARFDVTLGYRGNFEVYGIADPAVPTSLSQKTDIQSFVTLFNLYWDIATYYGITPYVGAGIGFAYNMIDDVRVTESGFETEGGDSTSFAWALMAGLAYPISPDLLIDANYRYINFGGVASGIQGSDGSIVPVVEVNDMAAHEIRIGVRYSFY